jgi:hypothetical protein
MRSLPHLTYYYYEAMTMCNVLYNVEVSTVASRSSSSLVRFRCRTTKTLLKSTSFHSIVHFVLSRDGQKNSKLGMGIGYWVFLVPNT